MTGSDSLGGWVPRQAVIFPCVCLCVEVHRVQFRGIGVISWYFYVEVDAIVWVDWLCAERSSCVCIDLNDISLHLNIRRIVFVRIVSTWISRYCQIHSCSIQIVQSSKRTAWNVYQWSTWFWINYQRRSRSLNFLVHDSLSSNNHIAGLSTC